MTIRFDIPYRRIECARCHTTRVRGLACPDCGRLPDTWEIDDHTRRRQQVVPRLEALLDEQPETAPWRSLEQFRHEVFGELQPILPTLFQAIRGFVQGDDEGVGLEAAIADFVQLRERIHRVDQRRPFLLLACTTGNVVDEIEQMLRCYLGALTADVPLRAQQLAEDAQTHIDRAAAHFDAFNARADADSDPVDTTSSALLIESIYANYMARTGATLEQVLAHGEQRIADLLGVPGDTDAGLQLLLFEDYAAANLDHDRFLKTVAAAHHLFTTHGAELRRLTAASPELLQDYVDVQIGVFNSAWRIINTTSTAQTDRQVIEAALDLEVELVEGAGALVTRLLLLLVGHKTTAYSKLKQGNATEDLRTARQHRPDLEPLLAGLDGDVRTAKAHRQVQYAGSTITITPRSGTRTIEVEELLDILLEGIESMLACLVALRQALADLHIDAHDENFLNDIGLSTIDLAEIALRLMTGADTTIDVDQGDVVIDLVGDVNGWSLFGLVASLGLLLDEHNGYRMTHTDGFTSRTVSGPTDPYRGGTPAQEFDKQLRCIRVALTSHLNGQPWLNRDQLRKWAAVKATDALQLPDLRQAMRQTRSLVTLAHEAEDSDLEQLMRDCMRWQRLQEPDLNVVDRLQPWVSSDVDWEAP
jgi:hypothetical protein